MAEIGGLVAVAVVWSGIRLLRCGRCGVPVGLLQFLYRGITFDERCPACERLNGDATERPLPARFRSDPELERRGARIRSELAAMVWRQQRELRETYEAVALEGGRIPSGQATACW